MDTQILVNPTWTQKVITWFDTHEQAKREIGHADQDKWILPFPFLLMTASVLLVFAVGFSWVAFGTAVFLYFIRMFGITGVYHRYFSHRTYKTSRGFQFILALIGNSAAQRGPLWWAAHHRHHHAHSDQPEDIHSPKQGGFWEAHMLWWSRRKHVASRTDLIPDYAKYPELMFLDRFDSIVPLVLGGLMLVLGAFLNRIFPQLGTSASQMFVWGFIISTVVLFHGVATINSLSHVIGRRRFETTDTSRNNWLLAIITMGEGWHNNHHHYCNSTRQGFFWYEVDITYYMLKGLSLVGLVWDLKPVPARMLQPQAARPKAGAIVRPREWVPAFGSGLAVGAADASHIGQPSLAPAPARSPDVPKS